MCREWITILGTKAPAWNIPAPAVQDLGTVYGGAQSALDTAMNESTRTQVVNTLCRDAFTALEADMRNVKSRYFFVPPLTNADLVSLGLKPRDDTRTPAGTPTGQATLEIFLRGRHELGFRIVFLTGDPNDKANKVFRIWYLVQDKSLSAPIGPELLTKSYSTRRMRDIIPFEYQDSGSMAHLAVQIENGNLKGSWGPLISVIIP
jgi:hypothetical protein